MNPITLPSFKTCCLTTATLAALATGSLFSEVAQAVTMYRVSQESAPGVGDFDDNILGFIDPFVTNQTSTDYYQYGTPLDDLVRGSFNGPDLNLQSQISHLFLVDAADGLSLFSVHDRPLEPMNSKPKMDVAIAIDSRLRTIIRNVIF